MIWSSASSASSLVWATTTPLPAARPSALMTMGAPFSSTKDLAASSSVNTPQAAVGTPAFCMMSLAKALLPSSCAHHWARAEAADARLSHGVHDAEGEGKLRPGNHEINDVSLGKRHQTGDVAILQGDVFAFLRGPAVAGSTVDFLGFSASATFHDKACSRPPDPMMSTRMYFPSKIFSAK